MVIRMDGISRNERYSHRDLATFFGYMLNTKIRTDWVCIALGVLSPLGQSCLCLNRIQIISNMTPFHDYLPFNFWLFVYWYLSTYTLSCLILGFFKSSSIPHYSFVYFLLWLYISYIYSPNSHFIISFELYNNMSFSW